MSGSFRSRESDQALDGSRTYLQRGMLKASHNAIDLLRNVVPGCDKDHMQDAVRCVAKPNGQ